MSFLTIPTVAAVAAPLVTRNLWAGALQKNSLVQKLKRQRIKDRFSPTRRFKVKFPRLEVLLLFQNLDIKHFFKDGALDFLWHFSSEPDLVAGTHVSPFRINVTGDIYCRVSFKLEQFTIITAHLSVMMSKIRSHTGHCLVLDGPIKTGDEHSRYID